MATNAYGFAAPSSNSAPGSTVASALPTDVISAKLVILAAAQSGSGRTRLTTQAGTAAEVAALALVATSTDPIGASTVVLLSDAGIAGLSATDGASPDVTTTGDAAGGAADDLFTSSAAHGLSAGDRIEFITQEGSTLPTVGVIYFVEADTLAATTFRISTDGAGADVEMDGDITECTFFTPASTWQDAVIAIAAS